MTLDIRDFAEPNPDLRDWTDPCVEPTLSEILADPMIQLVFRRDSLDRDHVEHFLRNHATRLAARAQPKPCPCGPLAA
jgi:hypothetical protein